MTNALESSLWELYSHRQHYHAAVSTLAKIFEEAFTRPSYAMEDFLDHTYGTVRPRFRLHCRSGFVGRPPSSDGSVMVCLNGRGLRLRAVGCGCEWRASHFLGHHTGRTAALLDVKRLNANDECMHGSYSRRRRSGKSERSRRRRWSCRSCPRTMGWRSCGRLAESGICAMCV